MIKVLHINCNYTGNHVHRTMIQHLNNNEDICSNVFVPVYSEKSDLKQTNNVVVKKCFKRIDRFVFYYKSKKIRKAVENAYQIKDFDIFHAYTLYTDGNVAYKLNKKYNIPYVVAVRNTDVNIFFKYRFYLRRRGIKILQNASAVFFLSKAYKDETFNKYIPQKYKDDINKKTYIIPNGIDDLWFLNNNIEKNKIDKNLIKIVYSGRIDKNKNIETTQKALEILRNKGINYKFSVVGPIDNKKIYNRIIKNKNTIYFPKMDIKELINLYKKNDIFIMPSKKETFGIVYAEAVSQGLPVIYTKGQGFDYQFKEGVVGFHVDYNNPNEITKKIKEIIEKYNEISNNCLINCKEFKWDKICNKYIEIYKTITKDRGI